MLNANGLLLSLCVAEYEDASLSSWVNKERFQGYLQIDGFTLYELGETGGVKSVIHNMFFTPKLHFNHFQECFSRCLCTLLTKMYLIMIIASNNQK